MTIAVLEPRYVVRTQDTLLGINFQFTVIFVFVSIKYKKLNYKALGLLQTQLRNCAKCCPWPKMLIKEAFKNKISIHLLRSCLPIKTQNYIYYIRMLNVYKIIIYRVCVCIVFVSYPLKQIFNT